MRKISGRRVYAFVKKNNYRMDKSKIYVEIPEIYDDYIKSKNNLK